MKAEKWWSTFATKNYILPREVFYVVWCDGKDGVGLKLVKVGQIFQIMKPCVEKNRQQFTTFSSSCYNKQTTHARVGIKKNRIQMQKDSTSLNNKRRV